MMMFAIVQLISYFVKDKNIQHIPLESPSISRMGLGDFLTYISVSHSVVGEPQRHLINLESNIDNSFEGLLEATELLNCVVNRVAGWIHRNGSQIDVLPKTKSKFKVFNPTSIPLKMSQNSIKPFCNLKHVVPGAFILQQLLTEKCLSICPVCSQFTLNAENLRRKSTCSNKELAEFVNKCKEMLHSLSDVPSLPSALLSKIGDYGAKKTVDPNTVVEQCLISQLIHCEQDNVTYNVEQAERLLDTEFEVNAEENIKIAEVCQFLPVFSHFQRYWIRRCNHCNQNYPILHIRLN